MSFNGFYQIIIIIIIMAIMTIITIMTIMIRKKGAPSRSQGPLEAGVAAELTQEEVTPPLQAPDDTQETCPHKK